MKVSVIIPVLNGTDYIGRIIRYLDEQTYQDYEVLLIIDERSSDESVKVAKQYESTRVKVIVHAKGKLGIARNIGLEESSGEFIWFLDCDDRPLPTMLEKLMRIQDKYDADIVGCNFVYSSKPDQDFGFEKEYQFQVKVLNSEEAILERSKEQFPVTSWSKIFRKSLLTDNDIWYSDGFCEDIIHTYRALAAAKTVCYYDEPLYVYYQHSSSFCNNNMNSDTRGLAEQEAYGNLAQYGVSGNEEFEMRKTLVRIRSSGHMTYRSFKKFAKSKECRSLIKKTCKGVPEAFWYRWSPSTYYLAIHLFFRLFYYREGRLFTIPERRHDLPELPYVPLPSVEKKVPVTIGICAYNEEKNVERTVRSIFEQKCQVCDISKILIVSSGSTDRTDEIVNSLSQEYPSVKLIPQKKREGKNSAINLLFDNKETDIMVFLNADNIFENTESLDRLIEPLLDPKVGMVGGHPIPTNKNNCAAGYTVQLMWKMHHYVAIQKPKTGELIAFRDIGTRLPTDMQSDEDILRMQLEKAGYETVYAPEATILNHGPDNARDYIKQRTRVNIGENYMKQKFKYELPTHDYKLLITAFINGIRELGVHPLRMIASLWLEMYPRLKARVYVKMDKGDMCVWDQVTTTKKL